MLKRLLSIPFCCATAMCIETGPISPASRSKILENCSIILWTYQFLKNTTQSPGRIINSFCTNCFKGSAERWKNLFQLKNRLKRCSNVSIWLSSLRRSSSCSNFLLTENAVFSNLFSTTCFLFTQLYKDWISSSINCNSWSKFWLLFSASSFSRMYWTKKGRMFLILCKIPSMSSWISLNSSLGSGYSCNIALETLFSPALICSTILWSLLERFVLSARKTFPLLLCEPNNDIPFLFCNATFSSILSRFTSDNNASKLDLCDRMEVINAFRWVDANFSRYRFMEFNNLLVFFLDIKIQSWIKIHAFSGSAPL